MTTTDPNNRTRNGKGRFARNVDTAERDGQAARLRCEGHSYDTIAARLGYCDKAAAYRGVERAILATVAEPAAELRTLELARLDDLWQQAWAVMTRTHITVSNGRVVELHGQPIPDSGPTLQAIGRLLRIQERRARLLGLDAPTKVETFSMGAIEAEIARLSAELGLNDT
jgi:hypothetical protein